MVSSDGLKRFRPPQHKGKLGYKQANFEMRTNKGLKWKSSIGSDKAPNPQQSNIHVRMEC